MIRCYLALGSNLKTPQRQLHQAINALRKLPDCQLIKVASLYSNTAWGRKVQPSFYNTVVELHTRLTPQQLLFQCQKIEKKHGRYRRIKWGARTLDIDVLLFGNRKISQPHLVIPHPHMLKRDFVLIPLLEIAPGLTMPDGTSIKAEIHGH